MLVMATVYSWKYVTDWSVTGLSAFKNYGETILLMGTFTPGDVSIRIIFNSCSLLFFFRLLREVVADGIVAIFFAIHLQTFDDWSQK